MTVLIVDLEQHEINELFENGYNKSPNLKFIPKKTELTGMEGVKFCWKCETEKPKSKGFQRDATQKDGLKRMCKECVSEQNRIRYQRNKSLTLA